MRRIGVFGGTFDPIHFGHLAAAEHVRETEQLDLVLFVPNWHQPLKVSAPAATASQRLTLLKLAVRGNRSFAVSEIEIRQRKRAYSVETLDELRMLWKTYELHFMLGSDALIRLEEWREPGRLLREYRPIVMMRAGWGQPDVAVLDRIEQGGRNCVSIVRVPGLDITSSDVRARVRAGLSIRYLVPEPVRRAISQAGIYRLDGSTPHE